MNIIRQFFMTIVIAVVLVALGWTVPQWLPMLLNFIGAHSTLIQTITDLVQLVLWTSAALVTLSELLERRQLLRQLNPFNSPSNRTLNQNQTQNHNQLPSGQNPDQPTRLFICYKRHAKEDQILANYLCKYLTNQGNQVFIDESMRTGVAWLEEIDKQLKRSDFLVVLLSQESANSEMVRAEVRRAFHYWKSQGRPRILPVRMNYEELLPYAMAAFLDSLQYIVWQSMADNERVGQEILSAIQGHLPQRTPVPAISQLADVTVSEDGQVLTGEETLQAPLPEFDPRFLERPSGVVKLHNQFYVKREADTKLEREIVKWGTTISIQAPRQSGKTSLLVRGIHHAREHGHQVVFIDFQSLGHKELNSIDIFLRELAVTICRELRLDDTKIDTVWEKSGRSQQKLTYFLEDHVLPEFDNPIILAMDKADRLLDTTFYKDFFSLVFSWHNRRASHPEPWQKLNIVMAISTEPYLLIHDINQSPFNVAFQLELADFTLSQIQQLNQQYGSRVTTEELSEFMNLLGGQPYLTRKALYTMATQNLSWSELAQNAATDQGPFADHLRHIYWRLRENTDLKKSLREVIRSNHCSDEKSCLRLVQAGLIKRSGNVYTCRSGLYKRYFEDKLS